LRVDVLIKESEMSIADQDSAAGGFPLFPGNGGDGGFELALIFGAPARQQFGDGLMLIKSLRTWPLMAFSTLNGAVRNSHASPWPNNSV
jgi:hypothetical protein